jgi:protein-disulfide isomerase
MSLRFPVSPADHFLGNVSAGLTLIEYGDFECPHCKLAHPLIKRLIREMGNELHFVFRNFPLKEIHPHAYMSAVTAEAAGKQGKYWAMHDLIFENQDKLSSHYLISLAEQIDLDMERFAMDSGSEDVSGKIEADFYGGVRSGVNGTPTFFLNGFPILTYNESYASLLDPVVMEARKLGHNNSSANSSRQSTDDSQY